MGGVIAAHHRLAQYVRIIAESLGLAEDEDVDVLDLAAPLHDIGTIYIDGHLLFASGLLDATACCRR